MTGAVLNGSYDYRLVVLSVAIAMVAAYAALDLGGRVAATSGRLRGIWLTGGAFAMGTGIWSMHYIGMLAYRLPVSVLYDWPTVVASLLAAVLAAAVALFVVGRKKLGVVSISVGGLLMGSGIAAMHYIGMEAMRLPAMCHYDPTLVALSIVLAVAISVVALWLTFRLRTENSVLGRRKLASAALMGAAIPVTHYTGMAAVRFTPMAGHGGLAHAVSISALSTVGIGSVALLVLALSIVTSFVDRQFSDQSTELQHSEQRYRQLVESAQVILWQGALDLNQFQYINHEAEALLGYPAGDWLRTKGFWREHLHGDDRELVESHCRTAVETNEPRQFEHRMLAADGRLVWLRTSVRLVAGDGGNQGLVGVMSDITERKNSHEAALEASQAKSHFLAEIKRLNDQLKRENSRMSQELEITQRLQQMMLPREEDLSRIGQLDIASFMEPAGEVGGDYYDVISGKNGIVFGIGDVTGHGLESGVITIMVQTAVRTLLASGPYDSRRFIEVLNRVVYDNARRMHCDRNLTFSLLRYQDSLVTISGQHEEVLVVRSNGDIERHDTINLGFPLGLEPNIGEFIQELQVPLVHGDVMVLYTDGITEAMNGSGNTYGIERLAQAVQGSHQETSAGIREAVLKSLRAHREGQLLLDDVSLLVIKPAEAAA